MCIVIRMRNLVIIFSIYTMIGCSAPIKKEVASPQIADNSGISEQNIQEIMRVSFTVTSNISNEGVWMPGFIALSDSEFLLYSVDPSTNNLVQDLRILYSELHGIDLVKNENQYQVHILGTIVILALEIMEPDHNTIDQAQSTKLFNTLQHKNVPLFTSKGIIEKPFVFPLVIPVPTPLIF